MSKEPLILKHGGYRSLKSFRLAQLAYDVTVRFCDRYIGKRSRTHDQMVQAARSGVQNIAEGSAPGQAWHLDIRASAPMGGRGSMTQEELRQLVAAVRRRQCELDSVEVKAVGRCES